MALELGLNDNMVRRWIKAAQGKPVSGQGDFAPLALPAPRSNPCGHFVWTQLREGDAVAIDEGQLQALVTGLPWHYAAAGFVIDRQ